MKAVSPQMQDTQRNSSTKNLKKIIPSHILIKVLGGFPGGAVVENLPANAGTQVRALVWEDSTCHGATRPVSHNY